MSIVFFILSALCMGYFWLIVIYSGIGTDFCGIWVAFSILFLLMGIFRILDVRDKEEMPKRLPVFIYTTFAIGALTCISILFLIAKDGRVKDTQGCDYVIVIGDRVYEDGISSTLKKRLDKAAAYCEQNPDTVLVLSGGEDSGDVLPEALAMYNYLILKGIPDGRMIIEADSDTTLMKISNSLNLIEQDLTERMVPPPIMIGVLTSDYHFFRTLRAAAYVTEERIFPIRADSDPVLYVHQCVRECFAVIRDRLAGTL